MTMIGVHFGAAGLVMISMSLETLTCKDEGQFQEWLDQPRLSTLIRDFCGLHYL